MVLKYFSLGNGLGTASRAVKALGINAVCVGVAEVDADAIIVNYVMNGGSGSANVPTARETIIEELTPFNLLVNLEELDSDKLNLLYVAHFATKNLGNIERVNSLPTFCDLVIYSFNDLQKLVYVKRILSATPVKPKMLLFATFPGNEVDEWMSTLSKIGYYSVSRILSLDECGVPCRRGRRFVVSNVKQFSMDFGHLLKLSKSTVSERSEKDGSTKNLCPVRVEPSERISTKELWNLAGFNESDLSRLFEKGNRISIKKSRHLILTSCPIVLFQQLFKSIFELPLSTLTTTISVPSDKLQTLRLRLNILDLLKESFEGKCLDAYNGFIYKVVDLKSIRDASVSKADSSNRFQVEFSVKSVKPRINNVYRGSVKACYSTGIMTRISSFEEDYGFVCNVLIVTNSLDRKTQIVTIQPCGCSFWKGKPITFQITELQFDNVQHWFQCIGTHKCC